MEAPFSTPSLEDQPKSMRGPIIGFSIGFALIILTVIILIWNSKNAETRNPVRPAVMETANVVDPNAGFLKVSNIHMSQAANMIGGKMYYVEGQVMNSGTGTITGATIEVTFRNDHQDVCQREQRALTVVLRREPALDVGSLSMEPLKPGKSKDFQIAFEKLVQDWNGQYPEVKVVTVTMK